MIAPRNKVPNKNVAKKSNPNGVIKWAVVGLITIAVLIGVILCIYWSCDTTQIETSKNPVARNVVNKRDASKPKTTPRTPPQEVHIPEEPQIEVKRYGRSSNVPTSNTNNIHYASQTGLKVVDADGNIRTVRSKPIFKSRADNMLWAAVRPGGMPSGLNALRSRMRFQTGSDEAFLAALRNQDITIEPEDPPHVVHAKKMTMEIKQGIIAELDKGRSFDDIYTEISAETKKERMYERIAQEDMRKITKARDAAAMRKYVEDMNPVMRELGLKELRLPSWAEIDEANIETIEN